MKPTYKTIKAHELQTKDCFLIIGKKAERWAWFIDEIVDSENRKKILITTENNRKIYLSPNENVIWVKSKYSTNSYTFVEWDESEIRDLKACLLKRYKSFTDYSSIEARKALKEKIKSHKESIVFWKQIRKYETNLQNYQSQRP